MAKATVIGLHVKSKDAGGLRLPKLPVDSARVTVEGMEGDYNRHRHEQDGDNPDRALLIFPVETMRDLNDEGWPVRPGDLGENVTTEGMLNAEFDVGVHLRIGEVLAEVAENDMPCRVLRPGYPTSARTKRPSSSRPSPAAAAGTPASSKRAPSASGMLWLSTSGAITNFVSM